VFQLLEIDPRQVEQDTRRNLEKGDSLGLASHVHAVDLVMTCLFV
jgi:hypothetical protein